MQTIHQLVKRGAHFLLLSIGEATYGVLLSTAETWNSWWKFSRAPASDHWTGASLREPGGLFTLKKQRIRETLSQCTNNWARLQRGQRNLFSEVSRARIRGSVHKLEHKRFHLGIRKHFCAVWITKHWLH